MPVASLDQMRCKDTIFFDTNKIYGGLFMEKTKKDRLHKVMSALGLTDYRVYTDVPEITKNMMVKLRNGETKEASSGILEPFCKYYKQVNPIWLLTGEGSMLVDEVSKEAQVVTDEKTRGSVPYYGDLPVSAGKQDLATILDNMKPTGWINLPGMQSSIGAFPVIGCSMEPDIKPGDFISIIEVDRWERLDPDKTYMIITHDDRMIKHLSVDDNDDEILWCISPNYPKFKIEKSEIVAIYRVTFHGRLV